MIKTFQAKPLESKKQVIQIDSWQINLLEAFVIVAFALFPLFLKYPFRINIFLSWEGAYRLYEGHIPYKDFGLPMGFAYWLIPAMFFKIFGPYLITLVKAQAFLNLIAAAAFHFILKAFKMEQGKRLLLIVFFCLTYSFINFWPWYNHTVFVFELIGLAFLLHGFQANSSFKTWAYLSLAGLFVLLSFYTKQDGGGLAFVLCTALAVYKSISAKKVAYAGIFLLSFLVFAAITILPFLQHDVLYWFNFGQEPHYSRLNPVEILDEFLGSSHWLKFYMIIISLLHINQLFHWREIFTKTQETLFYLLSMGILVQASIIQITSYIPADSNIYYHSFALAYILHAVKFRFSFSKPAPIIAGVCIILFWWSGVYYKYVQRVMRRYLPKEVVASGEAVVSKSTFVINQEKSQTAGNDMASWVELPGSPAFAGVYMPKETVAGIERMRQMPQFTPGSRPKVLNMSELTPLAHELGFELEKGVPLWYHLNVSMFDKELDFFKNRVQNDYYDVVLFEYVPNLNNFYPFALQEVLQQEYEMVDRFLAPRYQNDAFVEVYIKRDKRSH